MTKLIILRGVPGSGKSTWALEWLAADTDNRVRINRDDIRHATFGKYWGVDENIVTKIQEATMIAAMQAGKDIVIDNTNLRARNVKDVMLLGQGYGYDIEFKDFFITKDVAKTRNRKRREAGERYVDDDVIDTFFQKFIRGTMMPPIPELTGGEVIKFKPYVETPGLPHAILVDIDGTLAHMDDRRGPYETDKYHLDRFDKTIAELVQRWQAFSTGAVIVMSGRDEEFAPATFDWLIKHNFIPDFIHMRERGDKRKDDVVKDELFEKHIAGRYNVDFILDDRDRVVKMWRAKGLRVLQVADGNF